MHTLSVNPVLYVIQEINAKMKKTLWYIAITIFFGFSLILVITPFFIRNTFGDFLPEAEKESTTVQQTNMLTYSDSTFTYKITTDTLSSTDGESFSCTIKSIDIFTNIDNKLIQIITPPDNSFFCGQSTDEIFELNDINFDEVSDFMIIQFIPSSPSIPYYFWRFNRDTHRFQRDTTLEEITSPNFSKNQKVITSSWRSGCCSHGLSTYRYINGKITLIEETEIADDTENPEQRITTRKKLVDGEMKLIESNVEN